MSITNYFVLKSRKTHHYYGRAGVHVNDYKSDQVLLFWVKKHARDFVHSLKEPDQQEWVVDSASIELENEGEITRFADEYRFLSNFHTCDFIWEGMAWHSSESAYQASKTLDTNDRARLSDLHPSEAKIAGTKLRLREDWSDDLRIDMMHQILRCKFEQNEELKKKLVATYPKLLIEGNYWNDTFWGMCKGKGHNNLGRLLMSLRDEFRRS